MKGQLVLPVNLRDDMTFDNFFCGSNQQLVSQLNDVLHGNATERLYYLWGKLGVGRSHLLQACCHHASKIHLSAAYIPLLQASELAPDVFVDLEQMDVVCIDDVDSIAGHAEWEEGLFHLYNRMLNTTTRLFIAAAQPPRKLAIKLPDLHSRLACCVIFNVHSLSDQEKALALQLRAKHRGLELSLAVAQFLMLRVPRDMQALFELLDKLIQAALYAQKRLTVPFVRTILTDIK